MVKRRKKGEGKSEKEGEGGLGKQKSGVILWDEYDVNKWWAVLKGVDILVGVRSVIKHNWRPPPLTRDDYRAVNESRMARCSGGGRELMRSRDRFPEYKLLPSSCFHLLPRSSGQADARASAGFYTHVEESHGPVQECTDRITHDTHHKVFIY